ncbi:MAG TPA: cation transporter, partial [Sediminibacterium sp.]|nr:cation transporter [Sediminibacterium sp.]
MEMEKVNWKVEGMSCTNCALTIDKYLQGKGLQDVKVNFIGGDVSFIYPPQIPKQEIAKGIEGLGYHVVTGEATDGKKPFRLFRNHLQRFVFCIILTVPLLLHMIPGMHLHWLMNPY